MFAQFAADLDSGFEDHEINMELLIILTNETSEFLLKVTLNTHGNYIKLNSQKHDTLIVSKIFFNSDNYIGNLEYKLTLEKNRYNGQQSMIKQTDSIITTIKGELKK